MSTITRRKYTSRRELGPYRRFELLSGEICYAMDGSYSGYGDGTSTNLADFISGEMKADWLAARDELLAFWRSGKYTTEFDDCPPWLFIRGTADTLPWAFLQFNDVP
jgi:hypothetical protein